MKKLMAQEETMVPNLFYNLKRALMPLLHDDTYAAMAAVTTAIEANNFNVKNRPSGAPGKRGATAVAADGEAAGSSSSLDISTKRIKVGDDAPGGGGAVKNAEEAEMEMEECADNNEQDNDDEPLPVCGADGGYCPPCYELA